MYISYLSVGFLDIGIKKHQGQPRQENLWLLSKVDGDCVTSHGLTAYHLFLGSYFEATLTTGVARGSDTLWLSSELFFTRHLPEFIGNMPTPTTTRAFVGYLSFFRGKVRVSRFTQKPFGSKNFIKPTLDMKQQVFPRNKLTNLKRSYFRFASPPTTESPGHDHFKQLPTPGPEGLELSLWLPEG